jgi:hypothetical protein
MYVCRICSAGMYVPWPGLGTKLKRADPGKMKRVPLERVSLKQEAALAVSRLPFPVPPCQAPIQTTALI